MLASNDSGTFFRPGRQIYPFQWNWVGFGRLAAGAGAAGQRDHAAARARVGRPRLARGSARGGVPRRGRADARVVARLAAPGAGRRLRSRRDPPSMGGGGQLAPVRPRAGTARHGGSAGHRAPGPARRRRLGATDRPRLHAVPDDRRPARWNESDAAYAGGDDDATATVDTLPRTTPDATGAARSGSTSTGS